MNAKEAPDLNDAALLVRVVQTRSFSAVARERGVPVSTVSRRVARLESALGIRLLERTTRQLRLTDAGRAYFTHAERAVDDLAQGMHRVRELQDEPTGRVRIMTSYLASALAGPLFGFLAKYPAVSVDLVRGDPRADGAEFDIALVTGRLEDTHDFVAREIWRSTRKLLFASPAYVKQRRAPRRAEDLARHDCIATSAVEGTATWSLVRGREKKRVSFVPRLLVSEPAIAQRAALAGVGIAMIPEVYCVEDVRAKRLVRVLDGYQGEGGGVHLLYRAHRSLTAAVRACIEHILAELPSTDPSAAREKSA